MLLCVTPMKTEHIDFSYSVLNSEHNKAMLHPGDISLDEWKRALIENLYDPDEKNFIITSDEPVAWLKINGLLGEQAWLSMIVVREDCQHQGIGSFAVRFSEDLVKTNGFASLSIHTDTDNIIARICYEKLGYTLTDERECANGDGKKRMGCTYIKEFTE